MSARPGPPVRVADLLLPTVLTLAGRGPASAEGFLTLLATAGEPSAGTRVTAGFAHGGPDRRLPAEVVSP